MFVHSVYVYISPISKSQKLIFPSKWVAEKASSKTKHKTTTKEAKYYPKLNS